jgi:RNase H-fold protein (predicted Holliday junction resolvase)
MKSENTNEIVFSEKKFKNTRRSKKQNKEIKKYANRMQKNHTNNVQTNEQRHSCRCTNSSIENVNNDKRKRVGEKRRKERKKEFLSKYDQSFRSNLKIVQIHVCKAPNSLHKRSVNFFAEQGDQIGRIFA